VFCGRRRGREATNAGDMSNCKARYPCPCCGYVVFSRPPGSYDICEICCWEDDSVQLRDPRYAGGANTVSLVQAQANYSRVGAKEQGLVSGARPVSVSDHRDPEWRPFEVERDNPESCAPDGGWERPWPDDQTVLYWWRPTYWRRTGKAGSE
jgi:hypothetical protein